VQNAAEEAQIPGELRAVLGRSPVPIVGYRFTAYGFQGFVKRFCVQIDKIHFAHCWYVLASF
jgi:hypothetical protein